MLRLGSVVHSTSGGNDLVTGTPGQPAARVRQVGHQLSGDPEELLDGAEIVQGLDHAVQVQRDVLVDHDVPETRQALQLPHQVGGEPRVPPRLRTASV